MNALLQFFMQHGKIINFIMIMIGVLIVYLYRNFSKKRLSNFSKFIPYKHKKIKKKSIDEFITIDDINNKCYINNSQGVYTGVMKCRGINYATYSESEKDVVAGAYINFLKTINFRFSKHIISQKKNTDETVNLYKGRQLIFLKNIEEINNEIIKIELTYKNQEMPKRILSLYNYFKNEINYFENAIKNIDKHLIKLDEQLENINGVTKSTFYNYSSTLTSDVLEGLSQSETEEKHMNDVIDKLTIMAQSLSSTGVSCMMLDNIGLLDLARLNYRPSLSNKMHIANVVTKKDSNVSSNIDIYAKVKVSEEFAKLRGEYAQ